jgi:hypothetical protein
LIRQRGSFGDFGFLLSDRARQREPAADRQRGAAERSYSPQRTADAPARRADRRSREPRSCRALGTRRLGCKGFAFSELTHQRGAALAIQRCDRARAVPLRRFLDLDLTEPLPVRDLLLGHDRATEAAGSRASTAPTWRQ